MFDQKSWNIYCVNVLVYREDKGKKGQQLLVYSGNRRVLKDGRIKKNGKIGVIRQRS